jgi:hypothetical protein
MYVQHSTGIAMNSFDHTDKAAELDRLLNDPEVPLDPARVWQLLAEISGRNLSLPAERPLRATVLPAT